LADSDLLYSDDDYFAEGLFVVINDQAVTEIVSQHHLFSGLKEDQLKQLWVNTHKVVLKQGECLFRQGDKAERFYFVIKGTMRLYRIAPSGHEKVVDIVRDGQCFGEALMFAEQTCYPVTSDALAAAEVIGFDNSMFMNLLRNNGDACFALMTRMSQRLHSQLNEIENLSLQNALHRLVNYLMQSLEGSNESLVLDVPKRHLASQLAIQPETLSRLLRKLTEANILKVEQNKLMLLDKQALYSLATDNHPLRANQ